MVDMTCAAFGEVRAYTETEKAIFHLVENIERLLNIIEQQAARIDRLQDTLFEIAPELEVIECMADDEAEVQMMIDKYMNHGNYIEEVGCTIDNDIMIGGHDGGHRSQNDSLIDGMKGRASDGGADFRYDDSDGTEAAGRPRHGCFGGSHRD